METGQVQINAQKLQRMAQKGAVGSDAIQGLDGFAAIFEQMAAMMDIGTATPSDGFADLMGNESEQDAQKPDDLMLQLAGAMLVQNPQLEAFFQMDDTAAQELVSKLALPVEAKQFLLDARTTQLQQNGNAALQGTGEEAALKQEATMQPLQQSQSAQQQSQQFNQSGGQENGAQQSDFSQLMAASTGEKQNTSVDTSDLQGDFLRNIREAKSLLDQTAKGTEGQPKKEAALDIDKLQSDVASNRFNPFANTEVKAAAVTSHTEQADAPGVYQQIKTGVAENLLDGKKEFVIKLRPEGLGEITVKLLEKPGGASTLSLITSSEDVAKMINSKLTSLQESMRPLHVEVHQAVPQASESSQANNQNQNLGGQQQQQFFLFDQQSGSYQQNARQQSHANQTFGAVDDTGLMEELPVQQVQADGLDTYI